MQKLAFVSALAFMSLTLSSAQDAVFHTKVAAPSAALLDALASSGFNLMACEPSPGIVDVAATSRDLSELRALGYQAWVAGLLPDPTDWIGKRGIGIASYRDQFFTFNEIIGHFESLRAQWPTYVSRSQIGTSHGGRPIWAYRIGRPLRIGSAPENNLVILGLQHAREWMSGSVVMHVGSKLVEGLTTIQPQPFLRNKAVYIIPVTNPDGYEYTWTTDRLWRKNRRNNGGGVFGVDLNRNWAKGWGGAGSSSNPSSEIYRGPSPFSEPENSAVRDLTNNLPRVGGMLDFHSYAEMVIWPWGYTTDPPAQAQMLESVAIDIRNALNMGGQTYVQGQGSVILYLASGVSRDWFHDGRDIPAYTLELRDQGYGFIPPTTEIIPTQDEAWSGVLALLARIPS